MTGTVRLASLTVDNSAALASLDQAIDKLKQAGEATETNTSRLRTNERAWAAQAARIPGTTANLERYAAMEQIAARKVIEGKLSKEEAVYALERLRRKYVEAGSGAGQFGEAMARSSGMAGSLKGAMGNLGAQIQDVTIQAQMGTNAFIIMAQQGPQIASAFGPAGAALGAVIAIASVAAGAILGMGRSADTAETSFTSYATALEFAASASEKTRNASEGAKAAIEAEARAATGAAQARLNKAQTELRALEAAMNFTASGDASANAGAAITYLFKSGDVRGLAQEVLILRAALGEYADGARDAIIQTETGASKLRDARGAIEDYRVGLREQIASLNVEVATFGASAEAKLRAKLEMEALATAQAAGRTQIDAGTRALIEQVVALQSHVDHLDASKKAMEEAAKAAAALATAQARAGASLFTTEANLDAKIAALKGGEEAMKAYAEEQVRSAARSKAYDDAIRSGLSPLDATAEATRIATKAAEAYRLEQQRTADQRASTKAESAAERDAKAYAKVVDELDRDIAAQMRLAGVVGEGVEATRAANTETRIAAELAKAHASASTVEGKAIADKVREAERWKNANDDSRVLDGPKAQLAYARQELVLMGEAEPYRERALRSFQIQQQALELSKTTTAENVSEWIRLQEEIADTKAIEAYQKRFSMAAEDIDEIDEDAPISQAALSIFEEAFR